MAIRAMKKLKQSRRGQELGGGRRQGKAREMSVQVQGLTMSLCELWYFAHHGVLAFILIFKNQHFP